MLRLKSAINFLDSAVEMIDAVLNPLTTIGTYVIYACMAGTAWLAIVLYALENPQMLELFWN